LQHRVDQLGEAMEDASLSVAFEYLSAKARKHLPFVGLFTSYVDADTLGNFVAAGVFGQEVYQELMGETLDAAGWEAVLDEASRSGFVRSLGQRIYELHPTLPAFFRRQLAQAVGEPGVQRLDAEFLKFYTAWAGFMDKLLEQAEQQAVMATTVEEPNLLRALRLAEKGEEWALAQAIAQTLYEFYKALGRAEEWRVLRERLLANVGRDMQIGADRDRADLWMYLLGEEANDAMTRGDPESAEDAYTRVVTYLIALQDPAVEPMLAAAYHQLGMVAEERQQFDQAEAWYRKALEIYERLGLERYAASDYHQLGIVAQ
jgi:tetratricopeptide (TPR) repeat protein